eukprot:3712325-Rhodomonas_salina.2
MQRVRGRRDDVCAACCHGCYQCSVQDHLVPDVGNNVVDDRGTSRSRTPGDRDRRADVHILDVELARAQGQHRHRAVRERNNQLRLCRELHRQACDLLDVVSARHKHPMHVRPVRLHLRRVRRASRLIRARNVEVGCRGPKRVRRSAEAIAQEVAAQAEPGLHARRRERQPLPVHLTRRRKRDGRVHADPLRGRRDQVRGEHCRTRNKRCRLRGAVPERPLEVERRPVRRARQHVFVLDLDVVELVLGEAEPGGFRRGARERGPLVDQQAVVDPQLHTLVGRRQRPGAARERRQARRRRDHRRAHHPGPPHAERPVGRQAEGRREVGCRERSLSRRARHGPARLAVMRVPRSPKVSGLVVGRHESCSSRGRESRGGARVLGVRHFAGVDRVRARARLDVRERVLVAVEVGEGGRGLVEHCRREPEQPEPACGVAVRHVVGGSVVGGLRLHFGVNVARAPEGVQRARMRAGVQELRGDRLEVASDRRVRLPLELEVVGCRRRVLVLDAQPIQLAAHDRERCTWCDQVERGPLVDQQAVVDPQPHALVCQGRAIHQVERV